MTPRTPSADRPEDPKKIVKRKLAYARRHLNAALKLANEIKWADDDRRLLSHTVGQVRDAITSRERLPRA